MERIFLKLLTIAEAEKAHLCKMGLIASNVTPFKFSKPQIQEIYITS